MLTGGKDIGMGLRDRLRRPAGEPVAVDFEQLVERDAQVSGWNNPQSGELLPGFDAPDGCSVLDIGCGTVPHSAFFADRPVAITLADVLPEAVSESAGRVTAAGELATVQQLVTDADPLPLPDHSIDRVIATEVLEHVADPRAFMAELVRVGKPGARYLISVPDWRSEELQRPFAAPEHFQEPNHIRVFGPGEFEALLVDAGLTIEHVQFDGFFHSLWWFFFWIGAQPQIAPPWHPVIESWMQTWQLLLDTDRGAELKVALDRALPKSQVVVARKPE